MLEKYSNKERHLTTIEEQFAALFGKTLDGKKVTDKKYMKYENVGESFAFVITGDMESTPQVTAEGKKKYMVKGANGKWSPMAEGSFDDNLEHFEPQPDKQFPVKVLQHKKPNGDLFEDFEPFDTVWELRAGNRMDKLEEALMEEPILLGAGVRVIEKQIDRGSKPYKYAIKIAAPKEAK